MSRYTNIVYIGRYLGLTYTERFFQQFAAFLARFVGQQIVRVESVNSTSFSDMLEN